MDRRYKVANEGAKKVHSNAKLPLAPDYTRERRASWRSLFTYE